MKGPENEPISVTNDSRDLSTINKKYVKLKANISNLSINSAKTLESARTLVRLVRLKHNSTSFI